MTSDEKAQLLYRTAPGQVMPPSRDTDHLLQRIRTLIQDSRRDNVANNVELATRRRGIERLNAAISPPFQVFVDRRSGSERLAELFGAVRAGESLAPAEVNDPKVDRDERAQSDLAAEQ